MAFCLCDQKINIARIINNMIVDFHNDFLTNGNNDLKALSERVTGAVCAVFRGNRFFDEISRIVKNFLENRNNNLYLGLEDIGYANELNIEQICGWHPVCASLTWNEQNLLAGGCAGMGGLTSLGKYIVEKLVQNDVYIDCAHLNKESFCDLLDTDAIIVNSHTCLNSVFKHQRNIDDWQIEKIIERKGLVGITLVASFLGKGMVTAENVFSQVDYFVQNFDSDHVCFGTDFYGALKYPKGITCYEELNQLFFLFDRHGYDKETIQKIFTKNLQNLLAKKVN